MANWLLDYIEMTEYIPPEFRDQSFSMRELDLKVSIAMSSLENEIKEFFSKIDSLSPQDKQEQYEALLKKCEEASQVASTKIKIAERLHDLVEKSMRLLDQGLEKLKDDLIEGDKGYIVENIERRSRELDAQLRLEEESMMQRQQISRDSKSSNHSKGSTNTVHNSNHNHRHSSPAIYHHVPHNHNDHAHPSSATGHYPTTINTTMTTTTATSNHHHHNRNRNNSTGGQPTTAGRQKKREKKRINSAMTIFNRNSKTDEDSANQTFLASPATPDYLAGLYSSNSNSLNDVSGGDASCLALKGMMAGNRYATVASDKTNGFDTLSKARQPILTAKDAVHAVSPNPTNSDKLVSFSSNPNGDTTDISTQHNNSKEKQNNAATHISLNNRNHRIFTSNQASHLNNNLLSPMGLNNLGHNLLNNNLVGSNNATNSNNNGNNNNNSNPSTGRLNDIGVHANRTTGGPFSGLALSSRHDPIMMAASQAINATQNMTPGRRTSSLKASYAAVNSGRLQHPPSNHPMFDQANMSGKVYCKCRGTVHDINMIACDNANCKYEWFHYECVGITTPPAGEWYCDDCRLLARVQERPNSNKQTKAGSLATST